ncbi:hypothetical protein AURDEDRAFT_176164 [Auricularia subglabra TFB-10046 SS5]|uniref:Uncharacterized protein n=1 Tax=Auricularia subglabra (strain TFB-10046 / SS5) TaxID=717982 RepID=J0CW89_AURST|nr:hypothetical protein AURDEDRAFT_176164 [Auricularia subglabra TFB-10046 SS5]
MCRDVWEGTRYLGCEHFIPYHKTAQARIDCHSQRCRISRDHPSWCECDWPEGPCVPALGAPLNRVRQKEQGLCPSCADHARRQAHRAREREKFLYAWSQRP